MGFWIIINFFRQFSINLLKMIVQFIDNVYKIVKILEKI